MDATRWMAQLVPCWPLSQSFVSRPSTSFSSASEFQNMPHTFAFFFLFFLFIPSSDHQLSSHFCVTLFLFYFLKFSQAFYFFFGKKKEVPVFNLVSTVWIKRTPHRRDNQCCCAVDEKGGKDDGLTLNWWLFFVLFFRDKRWGIPRYRMTTDAIAERKRKKDAYILEILSHAR